MHRGLGIPGRFRIDNDGTITGPATDEVFMREYMKYYKRLMTSDMKLEIARKVGSSHR